MSEITGYREVTVLHDCNDWLQAKLLIKELEASKNNEAVSVNERGKAEGNLQQLHNLLKQAEWQLQDVTAMKNFRCAVFILFPSNMHVQFSCL